MKIDLHCHSKFSDKPTEYILRRAGCPESFSEPLWMYRTARLRGMTHVTITDHDTINGSLEIAHLPGTFVSVEVTARFPDDGCKVHVLVYDISERTFEDIQKLRANVYDLVRYLRENHVRHALAHPLYAVNGCLNLRRARELFLLFDVMELNGSRNAELNVSLASAAASITADDIDAWMDEIRPSIDHVPSPRKRFIGGSDDHSGLFLGRRWTRVEAHSASTLFAAVDHGTAMVEGEAPSPRSFARTLYSIGYQFARRKGAALDPGMAAIAASVDPMLEPMEPHSARVLNLRQRCKLMLANWRGGRSSDIPGSLPFAELVKVEVARMTPQDRARIADWKRAAVKSPRAADDALFEMARFFSNRLTSRAANLEIRSLFKGDLISMAQGLPALALTQLALSPYVLSYHLFGRDRAVARSIQETLIARTGRPETGTLRLAHMTDTIDETNGVAHTLRRQMNEALAIDLPYRVIACGEPRPGDPGNLKRFRSLGTLRLEEYPEVKWTLPPFLEILDHCYEERYTHIHAATPGPVGLAALAAAKTLDLPFITTHHTDFSSYARVLLEDRGMEKTVRAYLLWFYRQADKVLVPSFAAAEELLDQGLEERKIAIYPRGVDIEFFKPGVRPHPSISVRIQPDRKKLLYAGRLSKEKNLDFLVNAYREILKRDPACQLIIAGEGPYRSEFERRLGAMPATFLGSLPPAYLAGLYASCDALLMPSLTDTFGNVVLEAQASGLPVFVSNEGGPRENLVDGLTGRILPAKDDLDAAVWGQVVSDHLRDWRKLIRMGLEARTYAESRSFRSAFLDTWRLCEKIRPSDPLAGPAQERRPDRTQRGGTAEAARTFSDGLIWDR